MWYFIVCTMTSEKTTYIIDNNLLISKTIDFTVSLLILPSILQTKFYPPRLVLGLFVADLKSSQVLRILSITFDAVLGMEKVRLAYFERNGNSLRWFFQNCKDSIFSLFFVILKQ